MSNASVTPAYRNLSGTACVGGGLAGYGYRRPARLASPSRRERPAERLFLWVLLLLLVACLFDFGRQAGGSGQLGDAGPMFTELKLILAFALFRSWAIARTCRRTGRTWLALAALLAFLLGASASILNSGAYPTPLGYWEQIIGDSLLFVLILVTIDGIRAFRFIARGLVFAGCAVSLVALYPVAGAGTAAGTYFTMVNRLTLGSMNPNEYAYRLLALVVLSSYLLMTAGRIARPIYLSLTGLFVFSIALTYSRGAMIGAGIALALTALLLRAEKRSWLSVAVLVSVLALVTPFALVRSRLLTLEHLTSDHSALYRAQANALAWQTIRSHPLLGVGGNEVNTRLFPGLGVHNGYLLLLCDGGLLEFVPIAFLVLAAFYELWRRLRAPAEKGYALLCRAMAILLAVWAVVLNATVVTYPFWIVAGLAWAVILMPARQKEPHPTVPAAVLSNM